MPAVVRAPDVAEWTVSGLTAGMRYDYRLVEGASKVNEGDLVSVFEGSGITQPPAGQPYIDIAVGADNKLTPGESAAIVLEFTNPSNAAITYTTRVIAGPGCR